MLLVLVFSWVLLTIIKIWNIPSLVLSSTFGWSGFHLHTCNCFWTLLCFRPRWVLEWDAHVQQQRWLSQHYGLISLCVQGGILWRWILLLRSHIQNRYPKPHSLKDTWKHCVLTWLCVCVWSPPQTAMSVQRTATCVRVATVWTCQEASAVNVTWASYPLLTARPARVRRNNTAIPDYPGSRPLNLCPHIKLRWVIQKDLLLLWWMVVCFPVWRNKRSKQMLPSSGTWRLRVFWTWEVHNMLTI